MVDYDYKIVGEKIYNLRCEKNWSQEELANHLGIDKRKISRYEANVSVPEADILVKLAKVFNTSADYLIGITNVRDHYPYN